MLAELLLAPLALLPVYSHVISREVKKNLVKKTQLEQEHVNMDGKQCSATTGMDRPTNQTIYLQINTNLKYKKQKE